MNAHFEYWKKNTLTVLVTYNRPDHTAAVLNALSSIHGVGDLLILSDAPKNNQHVRDLERTRAMLRMAEIDFPARIIYQEVNQGLAKSVLQGVQVAFEKYEAVILLEDDCVPQEGFYEYMYGCLGLYQNNPKVFGISGYTINLPEEIRQAIPEDNYFFPRMGSWGWATWKDRWAHDDRNLIRILEKCATHNIDLDQGGNDIPEVIGRIFTSEIKDTWTLPWLLTVYLQGGLYVYPKTSYIDNIGMDGTGVHCGTTDKFVTSLAYGAPTQLATTPQEIPLVSQFFYQFYSLSHRDWTPAKLYQVIQNNANQRKPKILHVTVKITGGGGINAMFALAAESNLLGKYHNEIVSLEVAEPKPLQFGLSYGLEIHNAPSPTQLHQLIEKAEIVLVHWWNNVPINHFLNSNLPLHRLVMWVHVGGHHPPHVILPEMIVNADFVTACSPHTYNAPIFKQLAPQVYQEKTGMVYGPADFRKLASFVKKEHQAYRIGYIGLIDFSKMHSRFIQICAQVNIPNVKFVVCGHGGDLPQIIQEAKELGIQDRFEFHGYIENIPEIIATLDSYAYPLCEDNYSGSELNLQEVMYCGIAPVVFPYGGVKELVIHQQTGLVAQSEQEFVQHLENLYHQPELRETLGQNAKHYAEQYFGAQNAAVEFEKIFDRVMHRPKSIHHLNFDYSDPAKRFVQSLGHFKQPFENFLNGVDVATSTQQISQSSRLMFTNGIHYYHTFFPSDPTLSLWTAFVEIAQGNLDKALEYLSIASDTYQNHPEFLKSVIRCTQETNPELAHNCQLILNSLPKTDPTPSSNMPFNPSQLYWTADKDVMSEDDLFIEYVNRNSEHRVQIKNLFVVGAHLYQEKALFQKAFPYLENVVLFEPIPEIFQQLKQIIGLSALEKAFPYAIGDQDGTAEFHVTSNFASSSLLNMKEHREIFPWVKDKETIQVQVRKLDTVIQNHQLPQPDILFIDVQGAEYLVLSSIPKSILANCLAIYTESSTAELYEGAKNLDALIDLLKDTHEFMGFAPLNNEVRNHGNALFIRKAGITPAQFIQAQDDNLTVKTPISSPTSSVQKSYTLIPPPPISNLPAIPKLEPDGHFYSPLVNPAEVRRWEAKIWPVKPNLPQGVDLNDLAHLDFFDSVVPKYNYDYPYSYDKPFNWDGMVYYENNIMFIEPDARTYFNMLRRIKPKRILEVGSGFSTRIAADVNRRFFGGKIRIQCIEPYSQDFLGQNWHDVEILQTLVQDVPLALFAELNAGDILFVDSSHVSKTGSDVNFIFFEVLPILKPGVIIHFHDIFIPADYLKDWVLKDGRHWNEQYLLQAFLMHNAHYEVLFSTSYAWYQYPELMKQMCGGSDRCGGSFWLRKKA